MENVVEIFLVVSNKPCSQWIISFCDISLRRLALVTSAAAHRLSAGFHFCSREPTQIWQKEGAQTVLSCKNSQGSLSSMCLHLYHENLLIINNPVNTQTFRVKQHFREKRLVLFTVSFGKSIVMQHCPTLYEQHHHLVERAIKKNHVLGQFNHQL